MKQLQDLSKEELQQEVAIAQRIIQKLSESLSEKELQIANLKVANEVLNENNKGEDK